MILKSMTDFVLELRETPTFDTDQGDWYCMELDKLNKIRNYANFLKQPLTIGIFIPCDENGSVLEEPIECDCLTQYDKECCGMFFKCKEYAKAKERCLFEGWDLEDAKETLSCFSHKIVEDLVRYNPQLTQAAQKQIGV